MEMQCIRPHSVSVSVPSSNTLSPPLTPPLTPTLCLSASSPFYSPYNFRHFLFEPLYRCVTHELVSFFPLISLHSVSELLKERASFHLFCLSVIVMLASLKFIFYTVCVTGVYWWEKKNRKLFEFLKLIIIK